MKKALAVIILASLIVFASACGNGENTAKTGGKRGLTLVTGTTTGVFYSLGAIVSQLWSDEMDIRFFSQASNGSVENLYLMQKGEADLGFSTVNMVWEAYNGEGVFKERPYKGVRILANLYPNVNHIIVRKGAGIKEISDLKGKSFVLGAAEAPRNGVAADFGGPRAQHERH